MRKHRHQPKPFKFQPAAPSNSQLSRLVKLCDDLGRAKDDSFRIRTELKDCSERSSSTQMKLHEHQQRLRVWGACLLRRTEELESQLALKLEEIRETFIEPVLTARELLITLAREAENLETSHQDLYIRIDQCQALAEATEWSLKANLASSGELLSDLRKHSTQGAS
jgi:hypothetical protein